MASLPDMIDTLSVVVLQASRSVAEPVQRLIVARDDRDLQLKWLGVAYESISFFIVFTTRMAQLTSSTKAQWLVNALGRALRPQMAARFFSRNPVDVQKTLLDSFEAGHYGVETDYGTCRKLFPENGKHDPDALVCRFAERLSSASGNQPAPSALVASIVDTIRTGEETRSLHALVQGICAALPPES